jgi:phage/plasmid-like protein (TIGR03299 family)
MAHRIQNNMLAYKGETPWHGLGIAVTPEMTGLEMLKVAKLDWKVQRRALAMRDGTGQGLMTDPLKGYRAIVREDTNQVFQVATDRYYPVQNEQVVDFFRQYCEAGHATMETVGGIDGGSKIWALAKLNGGSSMTIGEGDELKGYMLLATSHDGSLRTIGKATQVRVVCWNTLSAAIGEDSANEFKMKHSRKWTSAVAAEAREAMGMAIEQIQEANTLARELSHVQIDSNGRMQFVRRLLEGEGLLDQVVTDQSRVYEAANCNGSVLDAILDNHNPKQEDKEDVGRVGKAILEAIVNSPGSDLATAKDTLWGAVNGVTYFVDHERGRSQDTRLSGAWFGQGDQLKTAAVKVAAQMAGIGVN